MGDRRGKPGELLPEACISAPCRFEVYRADEVRMTSTRFSGGDWHWRLSDGEGLILLDTGGYPSEHKCREAIIILKESAAFASVSRAG